MPFDLLLSVARLGSLGLAAQAHGISQPAASTRIRRLERRLGVTLIQRSPHGSRLTPHGELVAGWAQAAVDAAAALEAGITSLQERSEAVLRVVASMTVAEYLLPGWLTALRGLDPQTAVALTAGNSAAVADAVLRGAADLGFVEGPDLPAGLEGRQAGSDTLTVVVAPAHPWARRRSGITAAELAAAPMVAREPTSGTAFPGRGTARPGRPGARAAGRRAVVDHCDQVGRRGRDRPCGAQLARGSPRARRRDAARGPGDRPWAGQAAAGDLARRPSAHWPGSRPVRYRDQVRASFGDVREGAVIHVARTGHPADPGPGQRTIRRECAHGSGRVPSRGAGTNRVPSQGTARPTRGALLIWRQFAIADLAGLPLLTPAWASSARPRACTTGQTA